MGKVKRKWSRLATSSPQGFTVAIEAASLRIGDECLRLQLTHMLVLPVRFVTLHATVGEGGKPHSFAPREKKDRRKDGGVRAQIGSITTWRVELERRKPLHGLDRRRSFLEGKLRTRS